MEVIGFLAGKDIYSAVALLNGIQHCNLAQMVDVV